MMNDNVVVRLIFVIMEIDRVLKKCSILVKCIKECVLICIYCFLVLYQFRIFYIYDMDCEVFYCILI